MQLINRHTFRAFLITLVLSLFVALPIAAQDSSPFPTNTTTPAAADEATAVVGDVEAPAESPQDEQGGAAEELPTLDVEEVGGSLVETIVGYLDAFIAKTPAFAVFVTAVVGLLKYTPLSYDESRTGWKGLHAKTLSLVVSALVWLVYVGAVQVGYQAQVVTVMQRIADLAPFIVGFVATLFGARWVHEQAAAREIAVLGKKTPAAGRGSLSIAERPTPGIARDAAA